MQTQYRISFVLIGLLLGLLTARASATDAVAQLDGRVIIDGRPAVGVTVTAAGNNRVVLTKTDSAGHFVFVALEFGTYDVSGSAARVSGHVVVDVGSGGASITLVLSSLKQIGRVAVARTPAVRGSGSDVTLDGTELARLPFDGRFSEMLVQLPGAVRGANGVVHLNGDHGVIDYQIDGVALPQALNRDIGSELNLDDIAFVDVVEGAYPAQYGLKFGSVLNLSTRSGAGPAGFDVRTSAGSYTDLQETIGYHTPLRNGGGASFALGTSHTTRGLDPPSFDSPHNDASGSNEFARLTFPSRRNDYTNVTLVHSYGTFQIPNDVSGGQPVATDDGETQEDTFVNLSYHHAIGATGALTFGPALKISRIRDSGDPANDFAYGEAVNLGNGGAATDCATAVTTGTFGPATCGFSLADDRTARDYLVQADYTRRSGRHALGAGLAWDGTRVDKRYAVTLQPGNFLAPSFDPQAAVTVTDTTPNVANTYQAYLQDGWQVGETYRLDYGLRYDYFAVRSTNFAQGFGAFSPRVKLTRAFGSRAAVYAYLGRFFEPFSFENVDPVAAQRLNAPVQPQASAFDLKPERDTQLEIGGHVPVGPGSLGFRVWQKNASDLIDDTQVGVTLLHQDINYRLGRLSQEALDYVASLPRDGRAYFSFAHTVSLNKGCETQLLAPCFGSPATYTPADHDQSYSIAGGALLNDTHGGWFSVDGEYGSGLSSASCPPATPGNCKRTPHTVFAVEKGFAIAPNVTLSAGIQNVLDDRYFVTLQNAQGNHFASPRRASLGVRFGR